MEKLNESRLKEVREFVQKEFNKIPARCRIFGMTRDLNQSEIIDVNYFNAVATVLNKMGALKEDALATIVPQMEQFSPQTVWEE